MFLVKDGTVQTKEYCQEFGVCEGEVSAISGCDVKTSEPKDVEPNDMVKAVPVVFCRLNFFTGVQVSQLRVFLLNVGRHFSLKS